MEKTQIWTISDLNRYNYASAKLVADFYKNYPDDIKSGDLEIIDKGWNKNKRKGIIFVVMRGTKEELDKVMKKTIKDRITLKAAAALGIKIDIKDGRITDLLK